MKKFSTMLLVFVLMLTVLLTSGCSKDEDEEKNPNKDPEIVEKDTNADTNTGKPVQHLLTRNGVVWKENLKINSKKGDAKYTTVWGDTLRVIAKTWKVNTVKLAQYNGMKDPERLNTGTIIYNYDVKDNGKPANYSADSLGD